MKICQKITQTIPDYESFFNNFFALESYVYAHRHTSQHNTFCNDYFYGIILFGTGLSRIVLTEFSPHPNSFCPRTNYLHPSIPTGAKPSSDQLGFQYQHYFSRMFKKNMLVSHLMNTDRKGWHNSSLWQIKQYKPFVFNKNKRLHVNAAFVG